MFAASRALGLSVLGLVALAAVPPGLAQDAETTAATSSTGARRVVVVVTNLRSDSGRVVGGLFASRDHWLEEGRANGDCHATIRHGRARCVFDRVPSGAVAFAGMHDEDGDGALDRDLLGIPSEGYAFSNDVREPLGPPSFDAASFATASLVVHARYGI